MDNLTYCSKSYHLEPNVDSHQTFIPIAIVLALADTTIHCMLGPSTGGSALVDLGQDPHLTLLETYPEVPQGG